MSRARVQTVTMVLTTAQVASFFEGVSQMATGHNTRVQFQAEGMTDPNNLADFTEEAMALISPNLKTLERGSKIWIVMPLREPRRQCHL